MRKNNWKAVLFGLILASLPMVSSASESQGQAKVGSTSVYPPATRRAVVKALTHQIAVLEVEAATQAQTDSELSDLQRRSKMEVRLRLRRRIEQLQPGGNQAEIRRETKRLIDENIVAIELQLATLDATQEEPVSQMKRQKAAESLFRLTKLARVLAQETTALSKN